MSLSNSAVLPNASIQLKNKTTTSNKEGEFRITVEDQKDWLHINFIGYKSLKIPVEDFTDVNCKVIFLTPEVQYLSEVVLNNFLIKGINKKSDGSISIDYTDFGILPGLLEPDLLQTIQALPGVISVNETVSDINVRGGTNDQNLILWDGIKMYQSGHFFGLISAFNPYLTKNVQLIRNGSSASYGDGVSSVIAMNTSNDINKKLDASIGVTMISADMYVDTPLGKKSSLQVSARRSISDVVETPTYDQYFDTAFQDSEVTNTAESISNTDQAFTFYDTSLRWLYQVSPNDLIKVNAILMRNDLVFKENAVIDQINISRESSIKQNNSAASLSYQKNWSTVFRSEVLLYGTNYDLQATNSDVINNQRLVQENEVLESGFKINTLLQLNAHFNLKNGYQFTETGISNLRDVTNPTFRDFIKEVLRTHSFFSEIEFKSINSNTHLTAGLRLNHFDKFDTFLVEPRISINHKLNNLFTVEVLGELKSQVTSQIIESQNDFLGIENRKWVLANNDNIPILKSQQVSFGITYNYNNWLISTDLYLKHVDGIITQSQGFQNQLEFEQDHGSYTVRGIDFLINKRFNKLGTWLSYSYATNSYTFATLSERDFPNTIDIRHNINFALSYSFNNVKFSSGINWHSGKPTTRPVPDNEINTNGTINYQHPNSETLTDYFRWDASATYDFKFSSQIRGMVGASIWNIVSRQNTVNNYYRITDANTVEEVRQFGLGFTPNVVFRVNF
nr:TonB-dependent receptor plug domain-containing protein [Aquimarina sp. U1-2]